MAESDAVPSTSASIVCNSEYRLSKAAEHLITVDYNQWSLETYQDCERAERDAR